MTTATSVGKFKKVSAPRSNSPLGVPVASISPGRGYSGWISEKYARADLGPWLATLPATLRGPSAQLVYRLRNRIHRVPDPFFPEAGGICVKSFKPPSFLRSLVFRRQGSKAARSPRCAVPLRQHGAGAAEPIGYCERWQGLRLVECHLFTRFLDGATDLYTEMSRLLREDPDCEKYIALLRFAAGAIRRMHDSGFVHQDLAGHNLLFRRVGEAEWADPCFIDLNRGRIRSAVSLRERGRDVAKLELPSYFRWVLFHLYFDDGAIPREFARWEKLHRLRVTLHNESRKYRHPIRTWIESRRQIVVSTGRPAYRDIWLWDEMSGQPSVVLAPGDRHKYRTARDAWPVVWHGIRKAPALWRRYRELRPAAYAAPVALAQRFGVGVEATPDNLAAQQQLLAATPGIPVLVRCYHHKGETGLDVCARLVDWLATHGHEVSLGLIQSRRSVLAPDEWTAFAARALDCLNRQVRFVEIGHAVNRVKWGAWSLDEIIALWEGAGELRRRHPHLTILGPAVQDFEYHHYPPLLARLAGSIDGLSNHLYVDRRGAPENLQGRFSLLEKCVLGRAMADVHGLRGFYVTETNWPLRGTGNHSPLAGPYTPRSYVESPLHVDEATYAAYMVRYALIALCSGMTERVWWWRLAARGYGLVDDIGGFHPRPAWHALVQFHRTTGQDRFLRREERAGAIWWHFDNCAVVYALKPASVTVPADCPRVVDLVGNPIVTRAGAALPVSGEPVYFLR